MEITVTAPNRIDLAGGTTDIYPLFLFMDGGCVVNAAIDTYSVVTIRTVEKGPIRVVSRDLQLSLEIEDPESAPLEGPLGLISRAVKAFPPPEAALISVENKAPKGSGLGASSSLIVALINGLSLLRGENLTSAELVESACEIETATIGVPTGKQDYIAAESGGVSLIDFHIGGFSRMDLAYVDDGLTDLEARIILSHTGESRFSGVNNWEVTKQFIDNLKGTKDKLQEIRDIARSLKTALYDQEWELVGNLIGKEWEIRRTLADGVSTGRIESIMEAAKEAGAWSSKICGAGGGGCMITMADPEHRGVVETAIQSTGGTLIPMKFDLQGVSAEVTSQ